MSIRGHLQKYPRHASLGRLKLIWADGGYAGKLVKKPAEMQRHRKITLEIVKLKGFRVLSKRRIVGRTFGWQVQSQRLVRNYEVKTRHSEAMIYLSMIKRMLAGVTR